MPAELVKDAKKWKTGSFDIHGTCRMQDSSLKDGGGQPTTHELNPKLHRTDPGKPLR